jgi:hypothetical protein
MKKYRGRMMDDKNSNRRLMWHGMFLFLLGLLTGLSNSISPTPGWGWRTLEGVMNGFSGRPWCDLGGGETFRASEGRDLLERVVRHIRQLGGHYAGGDVGAASLSPITGGRAPCPGRRRL